jgi:hypothetical protein
MPISGVRLSNAKLGVGVRFHRLVSGRAQALGVSSERRFIRNKDSRELGLRIVGRFDYRDQRCNWVLRLPSFNVNSVSAFIERVPLCQITRRKVSKKAELWDQGPLIVLASLFYDLTALQVHR